MPLLLRTPRRRPSMRRRRKTGPRPRELAIPALPALIAETRRVLTAEMPLPALIAAIWLAERTAETRQAPTVETPQARTVETLPARTEEMPPQARTEEMPLRARTAGTPLARAEAQPEPTPAGAPTPGERLPAEG
jgi:hypothetical protein